MFARAGQQKGVGKLTLLVFGAIIAAALYSGYKILPFFYSYYELQSQMDQIVQVASVKTDQEIRTQLLYHIKKLDIPVEPQELKVVREDGVIKVGLKWQDVFYITYKEKDYDIYTFDFNAYAEAQFSKRK